VLRDEGNEPAGLKEAQREGEGQGGKRIKTQDQLEMPRSAEIGKKQKNPVPRGFSEKRYTTKTDRGKKREKRTNEVYPGG